MAGKWTKVGQILAKKSGKGTYLKVETDMKLEKGMILSIFDPRKRPGITDDQLAKIPDFVKAEVLLAPPNDE